MDEARARELLVGDWVISREARHKVVDVAPAPWPPNVKLQGPYAADASVSYTLLDVPVLLTPPEKES